MSEIGGVKIDPNKLVLLLKSRRLYLLLASAIISILMVWNAVVPSFGGAEVQVPDQEGQDRWVDIGETAGGTLSTIIVIILTLAGVSSFTARPPGVGESTHNAPVSDNLQSAVAAQVGEMRDTVTTEIAALRREMFNLAVAALPEDKSTTQKVE